MNTNYVYFYNSLFKKTLDFKRIETRLEGIYKTSNKIINTESLNEFRANIWNWAKNEIDSCFSKEDLEITALSFLHEVDCDNTSENS